jgi:hypothetical protein
VFEVRQPTMRGESAAEAEAARIQLLAKIVSGS